MQVFMGEKKSDLESCSFCTSVKRLSNKKQKCYAVMNTSRKYNPFPQRKKASVHQRTTVLSTSKNVLFLGHKHLLTTGADDPLWLTCGYDLEIGHF